MDKETKADIKELVFIAEYIEKYLAVSSTKLIAPDYESSKFYKLYIERMKEIKNKYGLC
ncbi:hypothetical protein ALP26_03821 [Pseudomonas savastanoi pv. glycinea]|uniref:Uncharacterized protein n=1 Tax=Pseudomonas savastanoi pv. glycinea TaxID=318 RepID=A0A3M6J8C4_PSESG|nr:hypothetical protein [Pseudomonas savastanoi]EFW82834.1 hypothetical protein PsgRace4_27780 [Pseudomonas savastanoi pv. glycinea str. race 4]MCQ3008238.1 hypothetical protein [Pseudomonas savastanoi]RMM68297.1 hypothetical protein ALQ73_200071 [Pseudomonas savastanoi pv. glycinea]RMM95797.1 hypothetical protein ALQ70_200193 [Pseudomonas savastanoi pv. glycinea]RMN28291.1 hypothetical protein ALQ66_02272 [Pseudomonas savastanoi pv. glycinea]